MSGRYVVHPMEQKFQEWDQKQKDKRRNQLLRETGMHVCDACNAARSGSWDEARAAGWVYLTMADGDAATLCPECIPHE